MEFEKYVSHYREILSVVTDKDVALTILVEAAKDRRTAEINRNNGNGGNSNGNAGEKATQNQLNYLKKLGIEAKLSLSKAEASRLIDEAKAK